MDLLIQDAEGGKVGADPRTLDVETLAQFEIKSPLKAIRAKCLDCSGANQAEARKCTAVKCVLWPFRMSKNPFYNKGFSRDQDEGIEIIGGEPGAAPVELDEWS